MPPHLINETVMDEASRKVGVVIGDKPDPSNPGHLLSVIRLDDGSTHEAHPERLVVVKPR